MSEQSLLPKLSRRQFLKVSAVTAAVASLGDKLAGGSALPWVKSAEAAPTEDKWIPSICWHCSAACQILVHRVDGVLVGTRGNPKGPVGEGRLCARGNAPIMRAYNPYQVKTPMKRTNPVRAQKNPTTGEWEIPDPKWVEISWDEALNTVANKLKAVKADNPNKFVWMSGWNGRSDIAEQFPRVVGTINRISAYGGMQCGASMHFAAHMFHRTSSTRSDAAYNQYTISVTGAGGVDISKADADATPQWRAAKQRGAHSVVVDPRHSISAMHADEWIPMRPGTGASMASVLAMINIIVNELGTYDVKCLKEHTNAPYLIGPDGHYVRASDPVLEDATRKKIKLGKPLIWDPSDKKAKTWDDATIKDLALEGSYEVNGVKCQPAFQLLKDKVKQYTPEWAEKISGIPAATYRRLSKEYIDAAQIGKTIVLDGKELPFRPVTVGRNYQQFSSRNRHHQVMLNFAGGILELLAGAMEAVGGRIGDPPGSDGNCSPVDGVLLPHDHTNYRFKWPPDLYQFDTFYPVAYKTWSFYWLQLLDMKKYYCPYNVEAMGIFGANAIMSGGSPDVNMEAMTKVPFAFALAYHFDENTEMCDILLPEPGWTGKYNGGSEIRQPLLDKPIYDQRMPEDILTDLADRMGILGDWNKRLNTSLGLKDANALDPAKHYAWEEILDRSQKQRFGADHGLAWFKENGVLPQKPEPAYAKYIYGKNPKVRFPFYWDYMKWVGEELKRDLDKAGVKHPHPEVYEGYVALPEWRESAIETAAPEYDLWGINWKGNLMAMGMTVDNPWLKEMMDRFDPYAMKIMINSQTAAAKGIKDGDLVVVESGNTGLKLEGEAKVTELVHPKTIAMGGQYGRYSPHMSPQAREGFHYNRMNSILPKFTDPLSCAFDIGSKVKISKKV